MDHHRPLIQNVFILLLKPEPNPPTDKLRYGIVPTVPFYVVTFVLHKNYRGILTLIFRSFFEDIPTYIQLFQRRGEKFAKTFRPQKVKGLIFDFLITSHQARSRPRFDSGIPSKYILEASASKDEIKKILEIKKLKIRGVENIFHSRLIFC